MFIELNFILFFLLSQVFIDDFEKNLTECHTKGMEDDAVAEKASKASAAASKFKKPVAPGEKSAGRWNLPPPYLPPQLPQTQ